MIFIVDNLDTHKSESLVCLVADLCDLDEDLGKKGRRGILRSTATRAAFLTIRRTALVSCIHPNTPRG